MHKRLHVIILTTTESRQGYVISTASALYLYTTSESQYKPPEGGATISEENTFCSLRKIPGTGLRFNRVIKI